MFWLVAAAVGLKESSGSVVDSHPGVVQPAEQGVIGFAIESCLTGALGDQVRERLEVRQAGGGSHGDPSASENDQPAIAQCWAKRLRESDVRTHHDIVGYMRCMESRVMSDGDADIGRRG